MSRWGGKLQSHRQRPHCLEALEAVDGLGRLEYGRELASHV